MRVLDRSEPLRDEDRAWIARPEASLVVASKADLPPAWEPGCLDLASGPILVVSAESGEGLDELMAGIVARLVPQTPAPGEGVPFRQTHVECLTKARTALEAGDGVGAADLLRSILRSAGRPAAARTS